MILVNDIHKGVVLKLEGQLHLVVEFQHVNPGKGGGFVRTKLKNIFTQGVTEKTFRSGDKLEDAEIEERKATYQYHDPDSYNFMDNENYEQYTLSADDVGESKNYLKENMIVTIELYENKPISLLLPNFVELKITQSDPGVRGDTVSGAMKPATMETGLVVQIPLFVSQGEVIKIDTRSGAYVERVSK